MLRRVATWIREKDEILFARALAQAPSLALLNARRQPVEAAACDALLLTGGEDVDAAFLRQPLRPADRRLIEETDPARDAWEFPAVAAAFARGRPILGVCRGHQVLNVALGGTLHLHVPGHRRLEDKDTNRQRLRCAAGVPETRRFAAVNSSHHQAIDRPAPGLLVEAWARKDGVIEQVRHATAGYVVGVQYHPERHALYLPLFAEFAAAVRGG